MGSEFLPPAIAVRRLKHIAVDEIRNHVDGPPNFKFTHRHLAEILGNRRNPVALLNGKLRDRKVGAICSNQRDIGTVERGHKGKFMRRNHGARQVGAD